MPRIISPVANPKISSNVQREKPKQKIMFNAGDCWISLYCNFGKIDQPNVLVIAKIADL
jgi:hypothetical protein